MENGRAAGDHQRKGMLYLSVGSVSSALMTAMVKMSGGHIPVFEQLLFRFALMAVFFGFLMRRWNLSFKVEAPARLPLLARSVIGFVGAIAIFYANRNMPLADAQILQKLSPVLVMPVAALLLGEKATLRKLGLLLLAFVGVAIVVRPDGAFQLTPTLAALLSAFTSAMVAVLIRFLKGRLSGVAIIFWFSLLSFGFTLPLALPGFVMPQGYDWLWLLLIGVFSVGLQYFMTRAYMLAPASEISVFDYAGVVASPFLGMLLFSEPFTLRTFLGMAVIIAAGYFASKK